MSDETNHEPEVTHTTICEAMAAAFAEMPNIARNASNPFYDSKYTRLDHIVREIRPVLSRHGLFFIQSPEPGDDDEHTGVRTVIYHRCGEWLDAGVTVVPTRPIKKRGETDDKPPNAQSYGSAITYAKRYGLAAALGLVDQDDDDGNAACANGARNKARDTPKQLGALDFLEAVRAKAGVDKADARGLASRIAAQLKLESATATPKDYERAIAWVNEQKDLLEATA